MVTISNIYHHVQVKKKSNDSIDLKFWSCYYLRYQGMTVLLKSFGYV